MVTLVKKRPSRKVCMQPCLGTGARSAAGTRSVQQARPESTERDRSPSETQTLE